MNLRVGKMDSKQTKHRHRLHDIPEGTGFEDEDFQPTVGLDQRP